MLLGIHASLHHHLPFQRDLLRDTMRLSEEEQIEIKSTREFIEKTHVKKIDKKTKEEMQGKKKKNKKEIQDNKDSKNLKSTPNTAHTLRKNLTL